jgi:hypothetical protein
MLEQLTAKVPKFSLASVRKMQSLGRREMRNGLLSPSCP